MVEFPPKFLGVLLLLIVAMFGSFWLMWNYSLEIGLSYVAFTIGLLVAAFILILVVKRRVG